MLRLAIIRDDLAFEVQSLPLTSESSADDVWRTSYFVRRASVSLSEVSNIFRHEVTLLNGEAGADPILRNAQKILNVAIEELDQHRSTIEAVRNSVGAHVRPDNAARSLDVAARVLANYPALIGEVDIDFVSLPSTSYRGITRNALLFAWPEVVTDEDFARAHRNLANAILRCAGRATEAIDLLLARHWWRHGLIADSSSQQLAVADVDTGEFIPVGPPKG
jgi:hypothetical protein